MPRIDEFRFRQCHYMNTDNISFGISPTKTLFNCFAHFCHMTNNSVKFGGLAAGLSKGVVKT